MIKRITILTSESTVVIDTEYVQLVKGHRILNEDMCYIHGMADTFRHQKMVRESKEDGGEPSGYTTEGEDDE